MDTGAHIVCNLLVQGKQRLSQPQLFAVVIFGAILPDLPIIIFYAWESLVLNTPESTIWTEHYYLPGWQNFIDTFNSVPITLAALAVVLGFRIKWLQVLLIGVLLHIVFDFPLHNDDAHRHFFPLSDWRFVSPVSYWDPDHYGRIATIAQVAFVTVGVVWLWIRHRSAFERGVVAGLVAIYIAFLTYAIIVW